MSSATATFEDTALPRGAVAAIWVRHLLSFLIPLNSLAFVWTGPHPWYVAPLFMVPIGFALAIDERPRAERRQPDPALPAWPFDAIVYALAAIQLVTVLLLARLFATQGIFSIDMLMVFLVVGSSSGFSIITAHELIHRRKRWEQQLGRLLLCSVLNEHFYTEHLRGHHRRVGLPEDPATARFGESYEHFYWRTIRGQLRSGWKLEAARLGDPEMSLFDRRMLRNRILHGLAVGWGIAFAILATCGFAAFFAFLLQAFTASRLLEAVNYFEHWGLRRRGPRVAVTDSWDTHSWFTYYGLVGLSRHADHHAYPARPFQQLRVWDEAPMLPTGYVGMVDMVMARNGEFQELATVELRRRGLGPFAEDSDVSPVRAAPPEPGRLRRRWQALPLGLRRAGVLATVVVVATLGVQWEAGAAGGLHLLERFGLHLWIAAVFVAFFGTHALAARRISRDGLCWLLAFAVLVGLGRFGEWLVA